jgi:PAS domain S-box-containing protein
MTNAQKSKKELVLELENTSRKLAELERLKKSQHENDEALRFSDAAFKSIHEGIIALDNEYNITYWNEMSEELFGLKASEAIGENLFSFLHLTETYPDEIAEVSRKLNSQGFNRSETLFKTPRGDIWLDATVRVIRQDSQPRGFIVTALDITARKAAEQALKDSEEKFYKAFNSTSNAFCISSVTDNKFLDVNDGFTEFTGYTREEAIGHTAAELKLWVDDDELKIVRAKLREDGIFHNLAFRSRRKSGEIRTGLGSAEIITIKGQPYRMVVIADVTEMNKAEEALRESEDFNSTLLANSPSAMLVTYPDGTIKYVNPAFEKLTGFSLDEIIGIKTAYPWWPVAKKDEIEASLKETTPGEGINISPELTRQVTFQKKNGELFTVELNAAVTQKDNKRQYIIVTWIDITERKKAEEALKRSEENFRNSMEDSPLGIRIIDTDGKTIFMNQALLDIYGFRSQEEFDAVPLENKFTPEMYLKHFDMRRKIANREILPPTGETSIVRKDGEVRHLEILTKGILWNGERLYQLLLQDVTERKKSDEKLRQTMASLEQSGARLAAANQELEAFSYSVSHDLRSPLRSIDGFSQALLEDYADKIDENGRDYLRRLRNASQKTGELIDGLLRLSRLSRSELHREDIDLSTIAIEITTRLRELQPERKVEFIIGKDLTANADPQLLQALLENLLGNAWKFTGKVPQAIIELGAIQNGAQKTFFVKDNGAGFDMTYVDKLFGAFQRLHDNKEFPGTGIGLATVRRIVNRNGGTVRAEGEVGKGAKFYFTLG